MAFPPPPSDERTVGRSDGKEGGPMKTFVAIVALTAGLLLSITTAIG